MRRIKQYGFTKLSALRIEEQRIDTIIDFIGPDERRQALGHSYRVEGAGTTTIGRHWQTKYPQF